MGGNLLRKLKNILLFPVVFPAVLFLGVVGFSVTSKKREEEEETESEAAQAQVEEADEDDPRKRSYAKDQWLHDYTGEERMDIARRLQSWNGAKVRPFRPFEEWQKEREERRAEAQAG